MTNTLNPAPASDALGWCRAVAEAAEGLARRLADGEALSPVEAVEVAAVLRDCERRIGRAAERLAA